MGLPFNIETPGQKKREQEIKDRVAQLDKLIGMFSKSTVFYPEDAESIAEVCPAKRATSPREAGHCLPGRDDAPRLTPSRRPSVERDRLTLLSMDQERPPSAATIKHKCTGAGAARGKIIISISMVIDCVACLFRRALNSCVSMHRDH